VECVQRSVSDRSVTKTDLPLWFVCNARKGLVMATESAEDETLAEAVARHIRECRAEATEVYGEAVRMLRWRHHDMPHLEETVNDMLHSAVVLLERGDVLTRLQQAFDAGEKEGTQ
jgi:hypothetical protein